MIVLGRTSDRTRQRRWHVAAPCLVAALALVCATISGTSLTLAVILLTIATMCILAVIPLFWPLPTALLAGTGAAAGIALINSIGNFSAFFSQPLMGWLSDITHSTHGGLYFLAAVCVAGAALTLSVPAQLVDR
jgi:MFS-type transporter involved in bile tolerance (Atg22 family)